MLDPAATQTSSLPEEVNMDPFEINATYRQQQLLDEARAEGLARSVREASPVAASASGAGLLGGLVRLVRVFRGGRPAAAPRKAPI
jgi:hypothetical protein